MVESNFEIGTWTTSIAGQCLTHAATKASHTISMLVCLLVVSLFFISL